MRRSHLVRSFALLSWLPFAAACGGGGFEPPSKIHGLRVLAMQKEPPYAKPGETVDLKLLYWDGKAADGMQRDIQVNFYNRCVNPPGDLYYNCFKNPLDLLPIDSTPRPSGDAGTDAAPPADASDIDGSGAADATDTDGSTIDASVPDASIADASVASDASDTADAGADAAFEDATAAADGGNPSQPPANIRTARVTIPPDAVHERAPGVTPYNLVYVLFTACAGKIDFDRTDGTQNGLPIACKDANKQKLGPDDFVPGYASIYVYDDRRNANPIVKDLLFKGTSFAASFDAPDADVPHVPRCTNASRSDCPDVELKVDVDRASAEIDPEANDPNGAPLQEQLWVAFHSTDGDFTSSLRLVNDATRGWNDDNAVKFHAPAKPGPVRVFAVVRDNRGGVAWAQGKMIVD